MLARICIIVGVGLASGGSALGQSIVLQKGECGFFFQAGYAQSSAIKGGEVDIGFAFSNRFDVGVGGALSSVSGSTFMGYGRVSRNYSTFGQFANCYPVRIDARSATYLLGLHQSYTFGSSNDLDPVLSGAASMNLMLHTASDAGVIFTAGYGLSKSGGDSRSFGRAELSVFSAMGGRDIVGLVVHYSVSEGPDVYGAALVYTVPLR